MSDKPQPNDALESGRPSVVQEGEKPDRDVKHDSETGQQPAPKTGGGFGESCLRIIFSVIVISYLISLIPGPTLGEWRCPQCNTLHHVGGEVTGSCPDCGWSYPIRLRSHDRQAVPTGGQTTEPGQWPEIYIAPDKSTTQQHRLKTPPRGTLPEGFVGTPGSPTQFGGFDPTSALAYFNRGIAYSKRGSYDKAIAEFTGAIKEDRSDLVAFAHYNRGLSYQKLGDKDKAAADFAKAIAEFTRAIEHDRSDLVAFTHYARGLSYQELDEADKADADFAKAKELGYEVPEDE